MTMNDSQKLMLLKKRRKRLGRLVSSTNNQSDIERWRTESYHITTDIWTIEAKYINTSKPE